MTTTTIPARSAALDRIRAAAAASLASGAGWPDVLAGLLGDIDATWQESAEVCSDIAWQARATGTSALLAVRAEQITDPVADPVIARAHRHLYLVGLRYDFRCPSIEALFELMPPEVVGRLDVYSRALWAFALLGQSRTDGFEMMDRVLVDAGDHPKVLQVLLHRLWLGHRLPGREERMLGLLDRPPFADRTDPVALFREAAALRGLGNYRKALDVIDRALDLLPPGDPAVHADFVRERSLITAADDWARLARPCRAEAR
ncbi:tetratricopeptide repeat protein [Streptomyces sp. NPDC021100]|uniref:tetratricopeptide repeat protein n=1 Tax=Streptomyces sp. NPDC021100 TaxID=3365114 RepID=UPI0037B22C35